MHLGPRWTRLEVGILAGITALSLFTHLAWLGEVPWQIEGNEYTCWVESMHFYRSPHTASMFGTGYLNLGMPNLWFWPSGMLMRLLGTELVGVRAWTALVGGLLVLPVYGLARISWGRTAAALAAFAIAVSAVLVHYSRMSIPNIGTTFWWTLCFYFLMKGLRSRRPGDFALAGLVAGTGQYTYYGTRLLPFLLVAFVLYMAVFHFRAFRERIGHFGLLAVGFAIGHGPLLAYFIKYPQMWSGRGVSELVIPLAIPTTWDGWVSIWNIVSVELKRNFLAFSVIASQDTFYYGPFLRPLEAVLLAIGIGVLVWRWRQPASFLMLLWGGSVLLTSSLLSIPANPNPNISHWAPAWSVAFFALALPLALWLKALWRIGPRWWQAGALMVTVGLAWMAWANSYYYLVSYPQTVPTSIAGRAVQGRFFDELKAGSIVRSVGCCGYTFDVEYARMLAPHLALGQLFNPSRDLPLAGDVVHDQVFVFGGNQTHYLPVVQYYYPGGDMEQLLAPNGDVLATSY